MKIARSGLGSVLIALLACIGGNALGQELKVERVSPAGTEVAQERGIFIEFNQPVVALGMSGRVAQDVPVSITPQIDCEWTWVKRDVLACQLAQSATLKRSTMYSVVVETELKTLDGASLSEPFAHEFTTRLPRVEQFRVVGWRSPERPFVLVMFDQPVQQESLVDQVEIVSRRSNTRIAADLAPTDWSIEQVFRENYFGGDYEGNSLSEILASFAEEYEVESPDTDASQLWILYPVEPLPGGETFDVHLSEMVQSAVGSASHDQPQTYKDVFSTFGEFQVLAVHCHDSDGELIEFSPAGSPSRGRKCLPGASASIVFSSPVRAEELQPHLDSHSWFDDELSDPFTITWPSWYYLDQYLQFRVWLRTSFGAMSEYELKLPYPGDPEQESKLPPLRDVFGRVLAAESSIEFSTDHYPAESRLSTAVSILESSRDIEPTILGRNIVRLSLEYDVVSPTGEQKGLTQKFQVPNEADTFAAFDLDLREKLGAESGVVSGTLHSEGRFENDIDSSWFFAQATPYHVFAKQGIFDTHVWVLDLVSGEPVEGAEVHLYTTLRHDFSMPSNGVFTATTNEGGVAELPGHSEFNPLLKLNDRGYLSYCYTEPCHSVSVRVEGPHGIAILPLTRDFFIYPSSSADSDWITWGRRNIYGYLQMWGTTAQGIYRRGDTVEYKGYVRDKTNESLKEAPTGPYQLTVTGPTQNVIHEVSDLYLNDFGAFDGTISLPTNVPMGWYRFELTFDWEGDGSDESETQTWVSSDMRFFVTDFTPNPLKVLQEFDLQQVERDDEVTITTRAEFHAGGPYANAEVRVNADVIAQRPRFDGPVTQHFHFDYSERSNRANLLYTMDQLDGAGTFETTLSTSESEVFFGHLSVESSVMSDRGKYIAATSRLPYYGVDRFVGMRVGIDGFLKEGEESPIEVLVVDKEGNVVTDQEVSSQLQRYEVVVARVRDAGGSFQSQYRTEWVDEGEACEVTTEEEPVACMIKPESPGRYRVVSTVADSNGNDHVSDLRIWVTGREFVAWDSRNTSALDMWCDNKEPQVGDSVKCFVENTLVGSTALVTVERYGVLDYFVQEFDTSTPVVEFTVKPEYAPGFYLSVLTAAPRVAEEANQDPPNSEERGTRRGNGTSCRLGKTNLPYGLYKVPSFGPQVGHQSGCLDGS